MHDESDVEERGSLGGAPDTPVLDEGLHERCETDRGGLTPKETADCAGLELAEHYENEEDGGS